MSTRRRALQAALSVAAVGLSLGLASAPGQAASQPNPLRGASLQQALKHESAARGASPNSRSLEGGDEGNALEVADRAEQYANERSAPGESAPAAALAAARQHVAAMPTSTAGAAEVTTKPYDAEPQGYTDPTWSNHGAGFGLVSGRVTALATDGPLLFAGAADGGVWRSRDGGRSWSSIWDTQDTLSIGALVVDSQHALWVGTGEANTSSDSYRGLGVYRSTDHGASFARVGGHELDDTQIYYLRPSDDGWMYAATSQGLWRHRLASGGRWQLVLKPDPNPTGSPYLTSMITDVAIRPGTHGQDVTAVLGWRSGSAYNGFYRSTTGGGAGSFMMITPAGDIDATDIGRTTLAYAGDGSRLYALVESPRLLLAGADTNLQGVFVSRSGNPAGPWTTIATSESLGSSGSALADMVGYHVGIQSWYNQALLVDPKNANKLYVSLEEVFQTTDGGKTFTTASPYWNYGLPCGASCPRTTHPDQHALAWWLGGQVVIGNDGGVYRRPGSVTGYGSWTNLNTDLQTLQYYDAKDGLSYPRASQVSYWGGLQDNGTSLLKPAGNRMVEPAGGDGGMVLVDPRNAQRAVGEYTNLAMYRTSDNGHTFTTISPECGSYNGPDCDPTARFIAPFVADVHDAAHWVAGGSKIWDTRKGWDTTCAGTSCDWTMVHDLGVDAGGAPNVATAIAVSGVTTYAGWVGGGGNPGPAFQSGIDTNYGGTWHRNASPALPNRYLAGLTVDPANPAHVYAVYNGYSRRWVPGGGIGVVFESTDGGSSWHNVTGNLPDAPGDGLAIRNGQLVLGTDVGVFTASMKTPTRWAHVAGVPNAAVNNVTVSATGSAVVAATHGRGIWRVTVR